VPVIRISNILPDGTVGGKFAYYPDQNKDSKYLLPDGAAVLAMSGATTGKVSILTNPDNDKFYQNQRVGYFNPNGSADYSFVSSVVRSKSFLDQLDSVLVTGAQPNISPKEVDSFSFGFPTSKVEQSKIGRFFEVLDEIIALRKRKLELLRAHKVALLQKFIPMPGRTMPGLRFFGLTEEWEIQDLGEVAKIIMGQSPDSRNYTDDSDNYILVQGNADMKDGFVVPRIYTTQITKLAQKGDLIISVRAPVGDIGKTHFDVVIGRGVAAIRGNEFLFQVLTKMKLIGFWDKVSTGSTFESINSSDLTGAPISLPTLEEQVLLGAIFIAIDDLIAAEASKLRRFELVKNSLLQQMFV